MERDDQVKGQGNSLDFGARVYDSRLGRWLSVDRAFKLYPGESNYSNSMCSPLIMADENGDWVKIKTTRFYSDGGQLKPKKWFQVFKKTVEIQRDIIVGDIVFINASYTFDGWGMQEKDRIPRDLSEDQKQQIITNYANALSESFNSFDEEDDKTFRISLTIAGTPKFIESQEELKGGEEVVIVGNYKLNENDASGLTLGKSIMVLDLDKSLDPQSKTAAHEFAHQRQSFRGLKTFVEGFLSNGGNREAGWIDHNQEGIFLVKDPSVNLKNIQTMRSGSRGTNNRSIKTRGVFDIKDQYQKNKENKDE